MGEGSAPGGGRDAALLLPLPCCLNRIPRFSVSLLAHLAVSAIEVIEDTGTAKGFNRVLEGAAMGKGIAHLR